jgi:NAD(P)-dependent dehydrogenase (short-subunit alcohol dehydrogenase family)
LSPGWIDTEMLAAGSGFVGDDPEMLRAATVARTPVRRWGTAADLTEIAALLADPKLTFHTGDVVTVDGGYSVQ